MENIGVGIALGLVIGILSGILGVSGGVFACRCSDCSTATNTSHDEHLA
jgi:hypothetical protein